MEFAVACRETLAKWRVQEPRKDVQRSIDVALVAMDELCLALLRSQREAERAVPAASFKTPKDLMSPPSNEESR